MPKGGKNSQMGENQPLLGRQDTTATLGSSAPGSDLPEDDSGIPALPVEPLVGKTTINPRDISTAFVRKVGSKNYDWSLVGSISAVHFGNRGLSEANMYHGIIDCHRVTPPGSAGAVLSDSNLHCDATAERGSPINSARGSNAGGTRASVSRMLRRTFSSSAFACSGGGMAMAPPAVCVIKHYDTSHVESSSMIIRAARHITEMTCESMARHELFFYTKVAPILAHDRLLLERQYRDAVRGDPDMEALSRGLRGTRFPLKPQNCFNTAELFFATAKDRGEPGLLRYVCCGSGSGSTTTLGMADLSNLGFSFTHSEDDGLYDAASIRAALAAMASLHCSMWGRFELTKKEKKAREHSEAATRSDNPSTPSSGRRSGLGSGVRDFPEFSPTPACEFAQNDSITGASFITRPPWPVVPTGGGSRNSPPPQQTILLDGRGCTPPPAKGSSLLGAPGPGLPAATGGLSEGNSPQSSAPGSLQQQPPVHPSEAIIKNPPNAIIARAIHRFGKSAIEKSNNNNDLTQCVPSLVELFRKWQDYWPVLGVPEVQRALRKVHKNWHSIRHRTARIINKPQTVIHGDFHYRNLGFRRINNNSQRKERLNKVLNTTDEARVAAEQRELAARERSEVFDGAASVEITSSTPQTEANPHYLGVGGDHHRQQQQPSTSPSSSAMNSPPELEACAVDFQGCGTGHIAYELLYFICCSLPVDIFIESSSGAKAPQRLSSGPGGPEDMQFSLSAGGRTSVSNGSGKAGGGERRSYAERAKKEHQFTLAECRELDNAIIREYYEHLSIDVRSRYSLGSLVDDLQVLVKHWAGCLLMDMANSSETERSKLKRTGLKDILEWGEKTATRVMWTLTSILTASKGRVSTGSSVDSCISAGSSFDSSNLTATTAAATAAASGGGPRSM